MSEYKEKRDIITFRTASVLAACLILGYAANSTLNSDMELRIAISDIATALFNLIASLALIYGACNFWLYEKRVYIAWAVLALGQISYTIGDILWAILEVGLHQSPFPSILDIGS